MPTLLAAIEAGGAEIRLWGDLWPEDFDVVPPRRAQAAADGPRHLAECVIPYTRNI